MSQAPPRLGFGYRPGSADMCGIQCNRIAAVAAGVVAVAVGVGVVVAMMVVVAVVFVAVVVVVVAEW